MPPKKSLHWPLAHLIVNRSTGELVITGTAWPIDKYIDDYETRLLAESVGGSFVYFRISHGDDFRGPCVAPRAFAQRRLIGALAPATS